MNKVRWWQPDPTLFFWRRMTLPKKMFWPYAIVCFVFCCGGAVNSGWSRYVLAIPFAAFLTWLICTRYGWLKGSILLPFFVACVYVFDKQDTLRFLYPGLGGQLTFTEPHCLTEYDANEYGPAYRSISNSCKSMRTRERMLSAIPAGAVYGVEAISHNYADMGDQVSPMIRVQGELIEARGNYRVEPQLQAKWAFSLGLLMMWLVLPIMIPALIFSMV